MGVGLRPAGKSVEKPPSPKAARAVFLSRHVILKSREVCVLASSL